MLSTTMRAIMNHKSSQVLSYAAVNHSRFPKLALSHQNFEELLIYLSSGDSIRSYLPTLTVFLQRLPFFFIHPFRGHDSPVLSVVLSATRPPQRVRGRRIRVSYGKL